MPLTVKTGAMKVKDPSSGNYVDVDMSLGVDYAPINSPEFAGTPKAPTATSETNNTQIATTAFVQGLVSTEASARQAADSAFQSSLNAVCLRAAVKTISGNGTSSNTLTGLTADHVVGNWGMFSDANCTTPIPENSPPCDITITTAANSWSVTIANYSSTFYLRPTFILKQN